MSPGKAYLEGPPCYPKGSLWELLEEGHSINHDHDAVIAMHQNPDHLAELVGVQTQKSSKYLHWTFAQCKLGALKLAAGLASSGVKRGSVLMTFIPNCAEACLLQWVSALLQTTIVPLDSRMVDLPRRDELQSYMTMLKPSLVVVNDDAGVAAIDDVLKKSDLSPNPRIKIHLKPLASDPKHWQRLQEVAAQDDHSFDEYAAKHDDLDRTAFIMFTSGTSTGNPKGCPHTVRSLTSSTEAHAFYGCDSSTRAILSTPNFRIIFNGSVWTHWSRGATVILPGETFSPPAVLRAINELQPTSLLVIPVMAYMLAADPSYAKDNLKSLVHVKVGGDVVTEEIRRKTQQIFPDAAVITAFGMTEGGGYLSWPAGFDFTKTPLYKGISSIGTISPGGKVRIWDTVSDTLCRRGELGELQVNTDSVIRNYYHGVNPEAFWDDETGRRWFRTGDTGMIDDDGFVYIVGRIKDTIKRGGVPIAPASLESEISQFARVQTSVVAIPHETLGEVPVAILGSMDDLQKGAVEKLIVEKFGSEYALGGVVSLSQLGYKTWPLNATGKVMKLDLTKAVRRYLSGSE